MQVGFQLSYSALLGIIFFQPKIARLLFIPNRVGNFFWQITAVSIAAQIGTLPISLYYFNQFPTYFLLSNIVVIPVAWLILHTGLLLFMISPFPLLSSIVGGFLNAVLYALNEVLVFLQALPLSVIQGLSVSAYESLAMYVIIILLAIFSLYKKASYLKWSLYVCVIVAAAWSLVKATQIQQKQITIYHIRRGSAVELVKGHNAVLFTDQATYESKNTLKYVAEQHQLKKGVRKTEHYSLKDFNNNESTAFFQNNLYLNKPFMQFFDKRIMVVDKKFDSCNTSERLEVDYLLIRNNPALYMDRLLTCIKAKQIIFDASNTSWKLKKWLAFCDSIQQPYHNINEQGALVLRWQ